MPDPLQHSNPESQINQELHFLVAFRALGDLGGSLLCVRIWGCWKSRDLELQGVLECLSEEQVLEGRMTADSKES